MCVPCRDPISCCSAHDMHRPVAPPAPRHTDMHSLSQCSPPAVYRKQLRKEEKARQKQEQREKRNLERERRKVEKEARIKRAQEEAARRAVEATQEGQDIILKLQ